MRTATLSQTQSLLSGSAELSLAHHDMFDPDIVALLTRNLGLNGSNDN
ncbi:hypothetical protein [Advenella mimigardefordensis]|nr:hypothetical protein [Advenella mimigardefordensis]